MQRINSSITIRILEIWSQTNCHNKIHPEQIFNPSQDNQHTLTPTSSLAVKYSIKCKFIDS